jgi:hypothetical protein
LVPFGGVKEEPLVPFGGVKMSGLKALIFIDYVRLWSYII